MALFSVNAQCFDPYKNFKFRVKWDGRYVAGISKVSALKRTTEVIKHRDGGEPSTTPKSPSQPMLDAQGEKLPKPLLPCDIEHQYAPLAIIEVDAADAITVFNNCRRQFALLPG